MYREFEELSICVTEVSFLPPLETAKLYEVRQELSIQIEQENRPRDDKRANKTTTYKP